MSKHSAAPVRSNGVSRAAIALVRGITRTRARSALVVFGALLVAIACLFYGRTIRIDTRLSSTLPDTAPSVSALRELSSRKGSTEFLTVVAKGGDDEANAAMIDSLAGAIADWEETRGVYVGRDYTPIRDAALYFMEVEDLRRLRDGLVAERRAQVADLVRPGLSDAAIDAKQLVVSEADWEREFDQLDWQRSSEPVDRRSAGDDRAAVDVRTWLNDHRTSLDADGRLTSDEVDLIWPREEVDGQIEWRDTVTQPYRSASGDLRLLKATLSKPPTDIVFAGMIGRRIDDHVAEVQAQGIGTGVDVHVVSAYEVSNDVDTILDDLPRATWLAGVLVLSVLLIGFRNGRGVVLVLFPMIIALSMTLAFATAVYGELNALTGFLFAVLFGMGVDFSVHLFAHRSRQGERADWCAIVEAHLRPLMATMVTTVGCLLVLSTGTFKAFREFGIIAGLGVLACFACALILVPAFDTLLGPMRAGKFAQRLRIAALAGFAVVGVCGAPKVDFEKDTRQLTTATTAGRNLNIAYESATRRCAKTLALVADTPEDLNTVVERIEAEKGTLLPDAIPPEEGEELEPWVQEVYSVAKLIPERQDEKRQLLIEIESLASGFLAAAPDMSSGEGEFDTHLVALERLARAKPLRGQDLPDWALDPFAERDGRFDRIGHVCMRVRSYNLDELVALSTHLDRIVEGTSTRPADTRLVFADLITLVENDSRRLPLIALCVILIMLAADLRSVRGTVACFASLALGLGLTLGVMGLWPMRMNFLNLCVMPAVVGLGIDASIHLWHARTRESLGVTGWATLISALTTIAGFAGMLAARHPGLHSIGELGVLAIVLTVGVAFLVLYPFVRKT